MQKISIYMIVFGAVLCVVEKDANASEAVYHGFASGGAVFSNADEYTGSPAGELGFGVAWPVRSRLSLGLFTSATFAMVDYGNTLSLSENEDNRVSGQFTAFIDLPFWMKWRLHPKYSMDISFGPAFMVSSELEAISLIPAPSLGIGMDAQLVKTGAISWHLRLQWETILLVANDSLPLFSILQLGVAISF